MTSIEVKEALLLAFRSRFWLISTEMTEIRVTYCLSLPCIQSIFDFDLLLYASNKHQLGPQCVLLTEPLIYAIE